MTIFGLNPSSNICRLIASGIFSFLIHGVALAESSANSVQQSVEAGTDHALSQITSVSQLADVPSDWAFQALQSLVEDYGCISGYLDSQYKGNRSLSRSEFAVGLNACLAHMTELLAANSILLPK